MIEQIQIKLEDVYRLPLFPKVQQYLLSPSEFFSFANNKTDQPQVIYLDGDVEPRIGIYLGKKIFKSVTRNKHIFSFQDFCVVSEEVSHFIYILWSKTNDKKINLLDLEIQAEVDKYLLARQIFQKERGLIERMFDRIAIRNELGEEQKRRYQLANRLGKKFALDWEKNKSSQTKKINWLRFFYRQNPSARISMIEKGLH